MMIIMRSFEELTKHFKKPPAVATMRNCIESLLKNCMTKWKHDQNFDGLQLPFQIENSNARVLYAGFMIALHQANVFHQATPETTALTEAAIKVTTQFGEIMDILIDHHLVEGQEEDVGVVMDGPKEGEPLILQNFRLLVDAAKGFNKSIGDFHNKFVLWKRGDQPRVIQSIFQSMCALMAGLIRHSGDDYSEFDESDPIVIRIKTNIEDLHQKMKLITGNDSEHVKRFNETIQDVTTHRYQTRVLREEHSRYLAVHGLSPTSNPCFDFIE